ncbi:MAG: hypothetical protein WBB37_10210 [bacterium]
MKHNNIERLIQKSLDFETNVEEERFLHSHLSQCKECHRFYQEMVQTQKALFGLIEYYPQHDFNDRVLKKLGFRKIFAWTKTIKVFAGAWLASILFLAFSPLPGKLINQILTSAPALARIISKGEVIISSLSHVFMPFAKNSFDITWPVIGLLFSVIITYFFSKTLTHVRKIKANIKSPGQGQNFLTG